MPYVRIGELDYSLDSPGSIGLAYEALDAIVRGTKSGKTFLAAQPAPGDMRKAAPSSLVRIEGRLAEVERIANQAALAAQKAMLRPYSRDPVRKRTTAAHPDIDALLKSSRDMRAELTEAVRRLDAALANAGMEPLAKMRPATVANLRSEARP